MKLSEQEMRNEYLYYGTISHLKQMLMQGLIDVKTYCHFNTKLKEKYLPVSDGLISEAGLITG